MAKENCVIYGLNADYPEGAHSDIRAMARLRQAVARVEHPDWWLPPPELSAWSWMARIFARMRHGKG